MKLISFTCVIFINLIAHNVIVAEMFTTVFVGIAAAGFAGVIYEFYCEERECCQKKWIDLQLRDLENDFKYDLFGQHLVKNLVVRSLDAHTRSQNPKKALALSFHGPPGVGKNYVVQMIINNLFKKKAESKYYHFYIGPKDFPHASLVNEYKEKLKKEIHTHTLKCEQSLFVFDEVDKIPSGVLDVLVPYMDYYEKLDGVDYRKNIFIFLSNTVGDSINNEAFKVWKSGKKREEITLLDLEPMIMHTAYNDEGGLYRSEIIKKDLIDVYVPFLPLERQHVEKCIEFELRKRGWRATQSKINEIAEALNYLPSETNLFSISGCKRISQKVDLFGND